MDTQSAMHDWITAMEEAQDSTYAAEALCIPRPVLSASNPHIAGITQRLQVIAMALPG